MTTLTTEQLERFRLYFICSCLSAAGISFGMESVSRICRTLENGDRSEPDQLITGIAEGFSRIISSEEIPVTTEYVSGLNEVLPDHDPVSPQNAEMLSKLIISFDDISSPELQDILEFYVSAVVLKIAGRHSEIVANFILLKLCLDHGMMPVLFSPEDMTIYNIGLRSWFWDNRILTDLCKKKQEDFSRKISLSV